MGQPDSITANKPVTEIGGSGGFYYEQDIESVEIPASIVRINKGGFAFCQELKTVTFASGSQLEIIDDDAFVHCSYEETANSAPSRGKMVGVLWDSTIYEVVEWNVTLYGGSLPANCRSNFGKHDDCRTGAIWGNKQRYRVGLLKYVAVASLPETNMAT